MQQDATKVNRDALAALDLLRARQGQGHTTRTLAGAIGGAVDHSTVSRWISGKTEPTGDKLRALLAWAAREGSAARDDDDAYTRGLLYACEAMSETVARLLRERREHDDARAIRTRAIAAIPPAPPPHDPAASETPPSRRRRGTG